MARVEDTYQKLTQLEHILKRPDTYIGSTERSVQDAWVWDDATGKIVQRKIEFVPGLYKIFDEIVVNAADNKQRDATMKRIEVEIDPHSGTISVANDGRGIPVEHHSAHGVYVPELIFGHLLTSSNYNDEQKKTVGGRNGFGAKLTNIFSSRFVVETADARSKYRQVFRNNMTERDEPLIVANANGKQYTKIIFTPDLAKFGMERLDDDIIALFTKRVYDLAGTTRDIRVYLNGEPINVTTFKQYVELYLPDGHECSVFHEVANDRWEVAVTQSDGHFEQVSFVNSICTTKGGTHVKYVTDQLTPKLIDVVKKGKAKTPNIKDAHVRNQLFVFVNALIENPAFDSQTKDTLTTRQGQFGSACNLSDRLLRDICKSPIVAAITRFVNFSESQALKKTDGAKKLRIAGQTKLDDANWAGGKRSHDCTLILTEGDSAKSLAVAGLSVVGRDAYGVFPLRGKLLNVRDASAAQLRDNAEIAALKQILGLRQTETYEDGIASLRYGHVMIMTDQDHDGSHIKGLIINFLQHSWPALFKRPGFIQEFVTPIVKAKKGAQEILFYTIPEYNAWRESTNTKGWKIKYYKGLGTSTSAEAKEYFSELGKHRIDFEYKDVEDDKALELVFGKEKNAADRRKEWLLQNYDPEVHVDHSVSHLRYADFVNRELILFSMADNVRSIPSVIDGWKPGQRKVLFGCFKRRLTEEIKVAQLAGYISEHTAYHHGEQSLAATIIAMAQSFPGSNNVNVLEPRGQFGTRLQGGKDAASPRYIFTCLSPLARLLFPEADDAVLKYLDDDGQPIEPEWYVPVLPTLLVNGADGIGTGWSTSVPSYNPLDVVQACKQWLNGEEVADLIPWYKHHTVPIERKADDKFISRGAIHQVDANTVKITELPVGEWTHSYKELLEKMLPGALAEKEKEKEKEKAKKAGKNGDGAEKPKKNKTSNASASGAGEADPASSKPTTLEIRDFREYHTENTVCFEVTLSDAAMQMALAHKDGLLGAFKLTSTISTSNMHAFDRERRIKRYTTAAEIVKEFCETRSEFYAKRKEHLMSKLTEELACLDNKVLFVQSVLDGRLIINNRKRADLLEDMKHLGLKPLRAKASAAVASPAAGDDEEEQRDEKSDGSYDYLLSMKLWSLTHEKVAALVAERDTKSAELDTLRDTTCATMWLRDLDTFAEQYKATMEAEAGAISGSQAPRAKKPKAAAKTTATKRGRDAEGDVGLPKKTIKQHFGAVASSSS